MTLYEKLKKVVFSWLRQTPSESNRAQLSRFHHLPKKTWSTSRKATINLNFPSNTKLGNQEESRSTNPLPRRGLPTSSWKQPAWKAVLPTKEDAQSALSNRLASTTSPLTLCLKFQLNKRQIGIFSIQMRTPSLNTALHKHQAMQSPANTSAAMASRWLLCLFRIKEVRVAFSSPPLTK